MITIDLQGVWDLYLDGEKKHTKPPVAMDTIVLPGSTAHAQKGKENTEPNVGHMTDRFYFEGFAWYSRKIQVDSQWTDKNLILFLERTRISTVFLDGEELDTQDSLCGFHEHDLTGRLTAGEHTLTIRVNNTDYKTRGGHMTSPDTQTNWNGIVGRIELQIREKIYPQKVQVYAQTPECIRITAKIGNDQQSDKDTKKNQNNRDGCGIATVRIQRKGGELLYEEGVSYKEHFLEKEIALNGPDLLWDEYHRNLLQATIQVGEESETVTFGIRKLSVDGRRLLINDKQVFWRGKHDGLVFPKTGYAPMTIDDWKQVFSIAREYGVNHYRFHTCCPPDAAFSAADEMGIYLEPELPFWGTIAAPGEEGFQEAEQNYLLEEGFRILRDFGNHPSFVMLSMGNELWGNGERINSFLHDYKRADDRHFYTQGSNNFQFCPVLLPEEDVFCGVRLASDRLFRGSYAMCDAPLGHIQTDRPNSVHNYDDIIAPMQVSEAQTGDGYIEIQYGTGTKKVRAVSGDGALIPQIPVISHEVGQYDFFPDFAELGRYEGSMQPLYLKVYQKRMEQSGIWKQWKEFYKATGTFAIDCYRQEIEAALRSKELSGFQLLDLQDFPGQNVALVGVLNAWMDSKGLIEAKDWRCFCSDTVILGEFSSFVVKAGDKMQIPIKLSVCNREQFDAKEISYTISMGETTITQGCLPIEECRERLQIVGSISCTIPDIKQEQKVVVQLNIPGTQYRNIYTLWAYPEYKVEILKERISYNNVSIRLVETIEEALRCMEQGEKVICIPPKGDMDVEGTYCTDFWNYPMFRSISESMNRKVPVGTLGLYIPQGTKFADRFLCESYSTPQWFHLVMHSHCAVLEGKEEVEIFVQPIDNVERAHKLGMLYYEKGVCVCTVRLWEIAEEPEVKAFAKALVEMIVSK